MPRYHRWFLLPVVEYEENGETVRGLKYLHDDHRINGTSSAGPFSRREVEDAGYEDVVSNSDAEEWRVAVAWGEGNSGQGVLQSIYRTNDDVGLFSNRDQDVAIVLNKTFGEGNWSVSASELSNSQNDAPRSPNTDNSNRNSNSNSGGGNSGSGNPQN